MAKIIFTPKAEENLYDIWAHIALDNPIAADKVFERIMRKLELAALHPNMGSPRPELSETARILIEGRYLLIYEPELDALRVIAIVHGMREQQNWG